MNRSSLYLSVDKDQIDAEMMMESDYDWGCNFKSDTGPEIIWIKSFFFFQP